MTFRSFLPQIERFLATVVSHPQRHGRWLNTLSFMENCGARQMAACQHPSLVPEEMLKHAAEEFRHAYHLKAQIPKVSDEALPDYRIESIVGGWGTRHYLKALDTRICKYLKQKMSGPKLREAAYVLTSYAIERRAEELYPTYQALLTAEGSPVSIKGIIREEAQHLKEMEEMLAELDNGNELATAACAIESELCKSWLAGLLPRGFAASL